MLLCRALIRPGFAYRRLLTLSMAYVACLKAQNFFELPLAWRESRQFLPRGSKHAVE